MKLDLKELSFNSKKPKEYAQNYFTVAAASKILTDMVAETRSGLLEAVEKIGEAKTSKSKLLEVIGGVLEVQTREKKSVDLELVKALSNKLKLNIGERVIKVTPKEGQTPPEEVVKLLEKHFDIEVEYKAKPADLEKLFQAGKITKSQMEKCVSKKEEKAIKPTFEQDFLEDLK